MVHLQRQFSSTRNDSTSEQSESSRPVPGDEKSKELPQEGDEAAASEISWAERSTGPAKWIFCASQWQECSCPGQVRWGNNDKWQTFSPKRAGEKLDIKCNPQDLEDIIPGDDGKHCQCQVVPGSSFYQNLNPMFLTEEEADAGGSEVVASCELFRAGAQERAEGAAQWESVEAFCSEDWEEKASQDPLLEAGDRRLDLSSMQKLMRARVDARFVGTYNKLFKNGWAPRAFVNYFAGPPGGKHAKMTEELVASVHAFSSEPIIVVHFGMSTSSSVWTPERFPRLVLLHAEPFQQSSLPFKRSFNFNKLRAFLFARVLAGVGLDSDQFVAPQVDRLFDMTEREITQAYPLAIMPVHFLDRGPGDLGAWWPRYCPDKACSLQTLRWGHAHPSWTFWALPFIGRWLRKNFRDETLPEVTGEIQAPALRVTDVPEDEDLLNVALWEEKASKQWCKYDIADPKEFQAMFDWKPEHGNNCTSNLDCDNIFGDARFYRHGGAAKLFYSAHHAVLPDQTKNAVREIQKKVREKSWPDPIVYQGKFWASGEDLRKAHPELECLA